MSVKRKGEDGYLRYGLLAVATLLTTSLAAPARTADLPELECLIEPYVVIDIGSPTHGIVDTLKVDRSDVVQRDDVLAKLDSTQQNAAVRKARARAAMQSEIETREAELELAERKQQRMRELYNSDAISSHARDEVETELKRAQMQLRQARDAQKLARIELERARDDLERRTIRSPIAGVVVERFVAPGEYVNEKPLMRLAQLHPLRIEAIAPATLFGEIEPGMTARVAAVEGTQQVHSATVTIVDKMIDAASGTFGIRLELPNPDYAIPSGLNCKLQVMANTPPPARTATVQPEKAPARTAAAPPGSIPANTSSPITKTAPAPAKVRAGSESTAVCHSFGPFTDASARKLLVAELSAVAANVRTRDKPIEVPAGYLVLTPKARDLAAARRLATELKQRGVSDLAVLTRGRLAGNVSLGLFTDKQNALARQQLLNGMGVETQIHERSRTATQLWLDAELDPDVLTKKPWQEKIAAIDAGSCSTEDYVVADGAGLAQTN